MTGSELHFVVPGSPHQRTGGYIYDARMVEGLRLRGWAVVVHSLEGEFPLGDAPARASLDGTLLRLPDGSRVVIDGLAMGAFPDVIRTHRPRLTVLALVHLLLSDETGLEPPERERLLGLEHASLAASTGVVATSPFTAARLEDIGIEAALIRTVPPGTDPAPLATGPGPVDPPRLLCVASVTPRKGQDVLVRALTRLADTPWTCVLAGSLSRSPAFAELVQAQVGDAGFSGRIAFRDECDEETIDELYARSSIFVLPSYFESYGMVLTEAMTRGLPVITTTGGAIPHTVPAEVGILVPPGDDAALAGAMHPLLADAPGEQDGAQTRRAHLGAAARRYASGLPTWDRAVEVFAEATSSFGGSER